MKNSFTIFEIILTLTISSFVIVYTMSFTKELLITNQKTQDLELKKINLLATKIFFQKHKNDLDKIKYLDEKIFFDDSLLLDNVNNFTLEKKEENINIKIEYAKLIKQEWEF